MRHYRGRLMDDWRRVKELDSRTEAYKRLSEARVKLEGQLAELVRLNDILRDMQENPTDEHDVLPLESIPPSPRSDGQQDGSCDDGEDVKRLHESVVVADMTDTWILIRRRQLAYDKALRKTATQVRDTGVFMHLRRKVDKIMVLQEKGTSPNSR